MARWRLALLLGLLIWLVSESALVEGQVTPVVMSIVPASVEVGADLVVELTYTNPDDGRVAIGVQLFDGDTFTSQVVYQSVLTSSGTDRIQTIRLLIPGDTTPSAALTGDFNYKVLVQLTAENYDELNAHRKDITVDAATVPIVVPTITSMVPSPIEAGIELSVELTYTNPDDGIVAISVQLFDGDVYSADVGYAEAPAPSGTDLTPTLRLLIPGDTTPSADLTGDLNYKVLVQLSTAGYVALTAHRKDITVDAATVPIVVPTITSMVPSPIEAGIELSVELTYTNPNDGIVSIALQLFDGDVYSADVGYAEAPAPSGTDLTPTLRLLIPGDTTPSADLTGDLNYKVLVQLSTEGYVALDAHRKDITLDAAVINEVITSDGTTRTVMLTSGVPTSGVIVTAIAYSPDESDHAAIIATADTTDPEVLRQIKFQPRPGLIVTEVKLLEEAVINIEISDSTACTDANPCKVTLSYTATDLTTLGITDPTDLSIFHYTGSQWEELGGRSINTQAMTITAATNSFSPFALATVLTTDLTPKRVKQLNEAIMPRLTQAMLASTITAMSSRIDKAFSGSPESSHYQLDGVQFNHQSDLTDILQGALQKLPTYIHALTDGTTDWRQMLANSSFALALDANDSTGTNTGLSVWGSGDYSRLNSEDTNLDWDGTVFSLQLGADKRIFDNLLLGALVSWSDGDINLDITDIEDKGSYQHQMTSVHPYTACTNGDLQVWGTLGYGQGELEIELSRGDKLSTDTSLLSLAAGIKGRLTDLLSLKSDLSLARTDIDKTVYSKQQDINSQRLRLLLAVEDLSSCERCTSAIEVGLRLDGGDGDSDFGAVLNMSMGYANPATGLTLEGQLHTLAGDDYTEWGLSGLIALTTAADGSGLAFSLSPSYGTAGSGSQTIWHQNQIDSRGFGSARDYQMRLDARLSFGFANGGGSLLMPYSEITFGTSNSYRLGMHWQGNGRFDVNLYGERRERASDLVGDADHAVLLEARVYF